MRCMGAARGRPSPESRNAVTLSARSLPRCLASSEGIMKPIRTTAFPSTHAARTVTQDSRPGRVSERGVRAALARGM